MLAVKLVSAARTVNSLSEARSVNVPGATVELAVGD
jgi:hypothetical protein